MSSNGFSPYTVPYSGVVSTANFVPGAAAHPPAPQDKNGQGDCQRPVVADDPVASDTSRSKGKSVAMGVAGGPPEDAIPTRFASAGAAAASGGIAIVPGGLRAGGLPSASDVCANSGSGQLSGQLASQNKEGPKAFNLDNKTRLPFGNDGQCDYEVMPLSPTLMTMSAQRRADRTLPVLAQELEAVKAENQRLRDSNRCLESDFCGSNRLRQLLMSLQNSNQQLQIQVQSLYMQMQSIQQQAQSFARHRDQLQARLNNADLSLEELTDLIVRLQSVIRRVDPDIFVTFPVEVQETLSAIHEEWKYQEYCKIFQPQQGDNSSGNSIAQPRNAGHDQSPRPVGAPPNSYANISSASSGNVSSDNSGDVSAKAGDTSATDSDSDSANFSGAAANDNANNDLLSQLFPGLTLGGLNIMSPDHQTHHNSQVTENILEPFTSETPSSIGTPRTIYSLGTPDTAQRAHATQGPQTPQPTQAVQSVQDTESPETTQGMLTPNTVDSRGTHNTPEH
ncbi:hypothetical protein CI238_05281 [Colletotrichum incanum]|uniref:Uncharacterized protein n=1 Tax=Colletotrichum incanum TaxID=1573173 RepID=A0A162NCR0_COLIC|nr:hypothetical protein CI238_05281 [Colletotrichum incanum]OHX00948.1 hypothetical protein CSPAE12_00302 [Colletotrichum incanum]